MRSAPFDSAQFATWREHSIAAYATDKVAADTWTTAQAPALSDPAAAFFALKRSGTHRGRESIGHILRWDH